MAAGDVVYLRSAASSSAAAAAANSSASASAAAPSTALWGRELGFDGGCENACVVVNVDGTAVLLLPPRALVQRAAAAASAFVIESRARAPQRLPRPLFHARFAPSCRQNFEAMHEALADPSVWDLLPLSEEGEEGEEGDEEEKVQRSSSSSSRSPSAPPASSFLGPLSPAPTRAQVLAAARDAERRRCLGPCPLNPEQQLAVTAALAGAQGGGGGAGGSGG